MRIPNLPRSDDGGWSGVAEYGVGLAARVAARTLARRTPADDDKADRCKDDDTSPICQKPTDSTNTQTLPIVLGAALPISIALIVLFFLHRRHVKKQRLEDANDPHKSLDFGMEGVLKRDAQQRDLPEMKSAEIDALDPTSPAAKHIKGFSLDVGSPYILPAGLHGSHESIRSMSRATNDEHDPYRQVELLRSSSDTGRPRILGDNGSVYSASTGKFSSHDKAHLVANAQRMSHSFPARGASSLSSPVDSKTSTQFDLKLSPADGLHSKDAVHLSPLSREHSVAAWDEPEGEERQHPSTPPESVAEKTLPPPPEPPATESDTPRPTSFSRPRLPRKDSAAASQSQIPARESSHYGGGDGVMSSIPIVNEPEPEDAGYDVDPDMIYTGRYSIDTPAPSRQFPVAAEPQRLSIMGVRPLPPENFLQDDNPEIRANRIRSFYKEYFDDSKGKGHMSTYAPLDDGLLGGAIYDPETGSFFVPGAKPFAQDPGRRAMTPPPRSAPVFNGGNDPHHRQMSTMSAQRGGSRARPPPRQNLPPPKPLTSLPTPSKLGYDDALINPIDYAPPSSFRDVQNGRRTDSPLGTPRPFSPSVRPFTPLASSFDDLAVMPSPHLLRKSGTFTALDFAPPRLAMRDFAGSDAGSIRSARSGISAMQMDAVRAGAYRVSRIPKEMVTTRNDFSNQLRPRLDMVTPA